MKVLQAIVKFLFSLPPFLDSALFSTIYSEYAWACSKCDTSWCVGCTLQDWWRMNPANILNTDSLCRVCFMHLRDYFLAIAPSGLSLTCLFVVGFLCQAGYVNGNPSGSQWVNRSKRNSSRSGFSLATTLPTNEKLRISLCYYAALTTLIAYVMIILQHPDHRDSSILFLGSLRGLKIRPIFGNELRHHCLLYGHGPNATSFIHDNSVPFLNAWNCLFQMMKSCSATKILSPQEQIILLRG